MHKEKGRKCDKALIFSIIHDVQGRHHLHKYEKKFISYCSFTKAKKTFSSANNDKIKLILLRIFKSISSDCKEIAHMTMEFITENYDIQGF